MLLKELIKLIKKKREFIGKIDISITIQKVSCLKGGGRNK